MNNIDDVILHMGDNFVSLTRNLGMYHAAGIFKTPGKTKKSKQQEVKYFGGKTPLEAVTELNNQLLKHNAYLIKIGRI